MLGKRVTASSGGGFLVFQATAQKPAGWTEREDWEEGDFKRRNAAEKNIPSRELTYPQKMAFWRWFSFSQGGIC